MSKDFIDLDKVLDNRIRLSIISVLVVENTIEFKALKSTLELTDGNLASHIKALEKAAYIEVHKSFVNKRPNTKFKITKKGSKAFSGHLKKLERLIGKHKN